MATPLPGPAAIGVGEAPAPARLSQDMLLAMYSPGLGQLDDDVLQSFLSPLHPDAYPGTSMSEGPTAMQSHQGFIDAAPLPHVYSGNGLADSPRGHHPHPSAALSDGPSLSHAYSGTSLSNGFLGNCLSEGMAFPEDPLPHGGAYPGGMLGLYGDGTLSMLGSVPLGVPLHTGHGHEQAVPSGTLGRLPQGHEQAVPLGGTMQGHELVPQLGGAWDAPVSPSVSSPHVASPEHSGTGAQGGGGGGGGGCAGPAAGDPDLHLKEKQRLAQKRFRDRQRDKMRNTQKQVEELSAQMSTLLSEKAALENRNRVLEQVVKLNIDHEKNLHCNREIMSREQEMLLQELATFVGRVEAGSGVSLEEAKAWTMATWIDSRFPRYMERLRSLLTESKREPDTSPAAGELLGLITSRRIQEGRRALFSCFYPAVFSWNREEMAGGPSPPPPSHWASLLPGLALAPQQVTAVLTARAALLDALKGVARERGEVLAGLALDLLASPRDRWHACPGVQRLLRSLGQERAAVYTFAYTLCDETLTARQEAYLDTHSYPWCPDLWAIASHVAAKQRDAPPLPALEVGGGALAPLMPLNTAFQLLTSPLLARGLGLRLKCGILMDPYLTVVPASAFPTPTIAQLSGMSIYDVHCGRYRSTQFQEWLRTNLPDHSRFTAMIPH